MHRVFTLFNHRTGRYAVHRRAPGTTRLAQCPPARAVILFVLGALMSVVCLSENAVAQDEINREPTLKSVFIYNFTQYIEWPDESFANDESAFVIGAVGADPVNDVLKAIARQRKAGSRPIEYREITALEHVDGCHIIFFSDTADDDSIAAVIGRVGNSSVLLVGEQTGFIDQGGVITFEVVDNRIKLKYSPRAAQQLGLKVSSQLAKIADIVN